MTPPKTILVVDDNESIYKSLRLNFRQRGLECVWAANGTQAVAAVKRGDIACVLMDLSLGPENGIEVMRDLQAIRPEIPVIIITGFGTFESAVKAIKLGARDFLPKPLEFGRLYQAVREALRLEPPASPDPPDGDGLISQDFVVQSLCKKARQFAKSDLPILITGESGTGKELLASLVHRSSPRARLPFLHINCSAFADTLVDNELFGHEKGAFTGAVDAHPGLFEQADGGTLHLDEIGDMSLATQAKILRVLEEGVVRRLGGMRDIRVNVRIVASTNKKLDSLIEDGRFRQDLFFRLNAVALHIPPLRERRGDVKILSEYFLKQGLDDSCGKRFSPEAEKILDQYSWPGNVRELRNVVKVCLLVTESDLIEAEDLPDFVRHPASTKTTRLTAAERDVIRRTLAESHGNKSQAAERLGISRRTLYTKMERYGLE